MQYIDYGYSWEPLARRDFTFTGERDIALARMREILESWEGTPYMAGQQCKQVGVDCVRFVCAYLDELYGIERTEVPRLPQDTAMHDRKGAVAAMRQIMRMYPKCTALRTRSVQPGDVFVVGQEQGGPGHAIVVGPDRGTMWQAGSTRVHRTGISFMLGEQFVHRVYRPGDRHLWAVRASMGVR